MIHTPCPMRVFVAEDDYFIADDIAQALEGVGAVVVGPVPTIDSALARLADPGALQVAILDINLGNEFVFPVADALQQAAVPLVFYSAYDNITLPSRFANSARISKACTISELVDTALQQPYRAETTEPAGLDVQGGDQIVDILPRLRLRARQMTGDIASADNLVEQTLKSAIDLVKREGIDFNALSPKLHELLQRACDQAKRH